VASQTLAQKVQKRFAARVDTTLAAHEELLLAIHNKKKEASLASMLAEQFVLLVNVMWEAFINDLVIAYVTLDSAVYLKSLKSRMGQSIRERFGIEAERAIKVEFPQNLSLRQAAGLLDPKKWNVTFDSAETLAGRANTLLAAVYAKNFAFSADDSEFINLAINLRNFLSHRSRGSREGLGLAIRQIEGHSNQPLRGPLTNVSFYLKARDSKGDSRAVLIARRFKQIAAKL
jgi:hypothetical protein